MLRLCIAILLLLGLPAASVAAPPDLAFGDGLKVSELRALSVQHRQTLKTLDSLARQTLWQITGRSRLDGQAPVVTLLDMVFRPDAWANANVIRIRNAPLAKDIIALPSVDPSERRRLREEGTVSVAFLQRQDVREAMMRLQSEAAFKRDAIGRLYGAAATMQQLGASGYPVLQVFAPMSSDPADHKWHDLAAVSGSIPEWVELLRQRGGAPPAALPGSEARAALLRDAGDAILALERAWRSGDAAEAQRQIDVLVATLPQVNPARYPASIKRHVEVAYNALTRLTVPAAFLYFAAFVLMLLSVRSAHTGLWLWGTRLMLVGLAIHTAGIAIRWWLVEKSVGNWFESIPIKNQFESVLMSAWFGVVVGTLLELRRSRGAFGAAAAFVGFLSLIAIFAAPYVTGTEIGGNIGQAQGVLMSYWLYIHVTMATASYALIGMSFLLGVWWLARYYAGRDVVRPVQRPSDGGEALVLAGGGAAAVGVASLLARLAFVPSARARQAKAVVEHAASEEDAGSLLKTLDTCNLVVMQLAFWILGVAIILGAVWADQSWGRPWGWDPKETFALVTWIVYLIAVHVRLVTRDRAWWTAVLSILGFIAMLFNWIGVNFFLVGLHSYA